MLHPTLFPASLHAIDISDTNSYDTVRPSLIVSVESDLMNHLHGLSTFLTSNNSETWHWTCVDAFQSWQRPRGYKLYKQPNNQTNKHKITRKWMIHAVNLFPSVRDIRYDPPQGSLTKNTRRMYISLTTISFPITLIHAASYRYVWSRDIKHALMSISQIPTSLVDIPLW